MVIGYIRVSTDKQDLDKQKHLLLEYAHKHKMLIDEFIEVEISSQKTKKERKIEMLTSKLQKGDILIAAELSFIGRNMLETLNIINELSEKGIRLVFVRQPELSTLGPHGKLLLAIYSYFAEAEREFISIRTKQGLAAAKAQGKLLGRPIGSKNKKYNVPMNPDKIFRILSEPDRIKDRKLSRKRVHIKWEEDNLPLNSKRRLCWRFSEKKSCLENLQRSMG